MCIRDRYNVSGSRFYCSPENSVLHLKKHSTLLPLTQSLLWERQHHGGVSVFVGHQISQLFSSRHSYQETLSIYSGSIHHHGPGPAQIVSSNQVLCVVEVR